MENNLGNSGDDAGESGSLIQTGDVIRIHMTGRVNSHEGPVFYTTDRDIAEAEGILNENNESQFGPRLVIVGQKQVLEGVEEALIGMAVGEEKKVEIEPAKAFGEVDPKKRRTYAYREYRRKFKKPPRRGDYVEMPETGMEGRVARVEQGKVIVDMNSPLAGRTVYYTIKVLEKIEGEDARLKALLEQNFSGGGFIKIEQFKIDKTEDQISIVLPTEVLYLPRFQLAMILFQSKLFSEYDNYKKLRMIFEFENKKAMEEEMDAADEEKADEQGEQVEQSQETGDGESGGKAGEKPSDKVTDDSSPDESGAGDKKKEEDQEEEKGKSKKTRSRKKKGKSS